VNFSRPQVRIRSTTAAGASCNLSDIPEEPSTKLQEHPIPNVNSRTIHVTAIHETACKESEWHIVRLPKTSAKACFAQEAITKKNCKAKIMQGNTAMPPHRLGLWNTTRRKRTRLWNSSSETMTSSAASKAQNGGG
jgi:hypothetical protein